MSTSNVHRVLAANRVRGVGARIIRAAGTWPDGTDRLPASFVSDIFNGKKALPNERITLFADELGVEPALLWAAKACDLIEFDVSDAQLEAIAAVLASDPE